MLGYPGWMVRCLQRITKPIIYPDHHAHGPVTTLIASLGLSWAPTTTWVNRLTPANFGKDQGSAETCAGRHREDVKTHGESFDRRGFWDGQLIDLLVLSLSYSPYSTNCGEVISRDRISVALKGHSASPFDRSVDTLAAEKKLKHASSIDLIRSIRGKGYLFSL